MKRTETFTFKISPHERRVIARLAAIENRSLSSTVRVAVMERAKSIAEELGIVSLVQENDEHQI